MVTNKIRAMPSKVILLATLSIQTVYRIAAFAIYILRSFWFRLLTISIDRGIICLITGSLWIPALHAQFEVNPDQSLAEAQQWLAEGKYQKAYQVFQHYAQERQNHLAQFTLGLFHQQGWGVIAHDMKKACDWYEKAAKGGVPTANHYLAQCFERGIHQPIDYSAAIHWYQEAANLGHLISLCALAELTMQGKGVVKDPHKALKYCQQAASAGSISAQLQMGQFYLQGDEAIRDPHKAAVWYGYAAEKGALEAYYHLGFINQHFFKNHNLALSWFETAASRGYSPAYFPAARLYFNAPLSEETGMPTADNLAKSYLWLSATRQQSKNENELHDTATMLEKVERIMPVSWKKELDKKVSQHLKKFHSQ